MKLIFKQTEHGFERKCTKVQDTKKFDCKAQIILREILLFTKSKLHKDTPYERRKASEAVQKELKKEIHDTDVAVRCIAVNLPSQEEHSGHVVGQEAGICQPIDKIVLKEIDKLVSEGVYDAEMQRHLKKAVASRYPEQSSQLENRRFHSQLQDIRNHMYLSQIRQLYSKNDQESLQYKVEEWKKRFPEDNVYCKLRLEDERLGQQTQKFLFVYQSKQQARLFARYGEIVLLDATYKTMRYSLPLFFLCVRTNVNYQVIGTFIVQNETKEEIKAGIEVIKAWNKKWHPRFFMTDFDEKEINALEDSFEGAEVYLCDFHPEQAWTRWVSATKNKVNEYKIEVLARLGRLAKAESEVQYHKMLHELRESSIWKDSPALQQWFSNQWLPEYKRWVWAFRNNSFQVLIKTNNGIERQNEMLKYSYLRCKRKCSVTQLATILVENFFPFYHLFHRYAILNSKSSSGYRKYKAEVPEFLKDRPRFFILNCMQSIQAANVIKREHIALRPDGSIEVQSVQALPRFRTYQVSFGNENTMPSCQCESWQLNLLPCKHIFAVTLHCPGYSWYSLPAVYRESPVFRLDDLHVVPKVTSHPMSSKKPDDDPFMSALVRDEETASFEEDIQTSVIEEASTSGNAGKLPKSRSARLNVASECRDYLSQIRNLTYLITDETSLKNLFVKLHDILEGLKNTADRDNGFILENTGQKIRRKSTANEEPLGKDETLLDTIDVTTSKVVLLPKEETSKLVKRRYGQAYETRVAHKNVNLNIDTGLPGN
ncbi:uncharacterized protein LOC135693148 [Rhopilema esculentum]|uniref:uncharacterized protein LOC135693148 n=1 Tax=Rhopilema esculentum TaxID=499914 RepID=UPI0031DF76DC